MVITEKYKTFKPTSINWLDQIPKDWQIRRLQFSTSIRNSGVNKKIEEGEELVRLCNYVDVYYHDVIDDSIEFMTASATEDEIKIFRLRKGDVIMTKDSESPDDIGVPAYVSKDFDDVICGYHLCVLRTYREVLDPKFLFYFLKSTFAASWFEIYSNGVTRFGLSYNGIKTLPVPQPLLSEQQSIAKFLDQKTAQIDALIEQKEKLLKLLTEKRTAIITQAVTKGLDPKVKMKESGIEWLGEVPEHWELKRLRFLVETNPIKSQIKIEDYEIVSFVPMEAVGEYGGLNLESEKEINEVYNDYTYFKDEDVVVAKITPCFENGKGALANGLKNGIAFGTTELHVLRPTDKMDSKFLFYLSISDFFRKIGESWMYGAGGQKRVPEEFLKDTIIPTPKPTEQIAIGIWLNQKINELKSTGAQIEASVAKLREYRNSLITSAVTGQIDVRKEVA
ncbi:MAG TPA: restriction endonuclease subunit S [Cyclobacteriaceae bacterium]|nr:restriction endonuclease subunit S [Cyclobacteriaceae bacterium]